MVLGRSEKMVQDSRRKKKQKEFCRMAAVFLDKGKRLVYNLIIFLYRNKPRKEGVCNGWTFQRESR